MTRTISATVLAMLAGTASAQLVGTGPNLPIPAPNDPPPPQQVRAAVASGPGWTGSWSSPAAAAWVGSFTAIGPIPSGATSTGSTRYDFTTLPTGALPATTFFRFGDVDGGSTTTEVFTLRAFDAASTLITTPWLDLPIAVAGLGTGPGSSILATDTPGWTWDAGTGTYTIDGSTAAPGPGNPSITEYLQSNTDMSFLNVTRGSTFASFSLAAPLVPAPASLTILGAAGLAATRRRR